MSSLPTTDVDLTVVPDLDQETTIALASETYVVLVDFHVMHQEFRAITEYSTFNEFFDRTGSLSEETFHKVYCGAYLLMPCPRGEIPVTLKIFPIKEDEVVDMP